MSRESSTIPVTAYSCVYFVSVFELPKALHPADRYFSQLVSLHLLAFSVFYLRSRWSSQLIIVSIIISIMHSSACTSGGCVEILSPTRGRGYDVRFTFVGRRSVRKHNHPVLCGAALSALHPSTTLLLLHSRSLASHGSSPQSWAMRDPTMHMTWRQGPRAGADEVKSRRAGHEAGEHGSVCTVHRAAL